MIKKTYKVFDMNCASCALLIACELEDLDIKAKCNYAKSTLDVEYDDKRINESLIKNTVSSLGYKLK